MRLAPRSTKKSALNTNHIFEVTRFGVVSVSLSRSLPLSLIYTLTHKSTNYLFFLLKNNEGVGG